MQTIKMIKAIQPKHIQTVCLLVLSVAISGCTLTKSDHSPSPIVTSPEALAFSVDKSLKSRLSNNAARSLSNAEAQALNFGQPGEVIVWSGQNANVSGSVVAFQPYRVGQSNCRRFEHKIKADSTALQASGTACKAQQQVWVLVD